MSGFANNLHEGFSGIYSLSENEIEAVDGGAIGCLVAVAAVGLLAAAVYVGWMDDHRDESRQDRN